ncbi:MAG: glycosyltransferase family 4 protein [Saprospiraceae bacterium]|nr:glycosyltransferase family 4 protein [Saprospiraceae bacterium]
MKIAINTRFLQSGRLEGFGWYTHELVRRMVQAHPEVEFLFLTDRPLDAAFLYGDNVQVLQLFPRARFAPLFLWWFEWSVRRALIKHGADVFFSPDSMCSLWSKVPVAMTCHDLVPLHFPKQVPWIHRYFLLLFLPRYLRRADQIITVSEYVRKDIIQTIGISPERVKAIHNGCREGFKPLTAAEKFAMRRQYSFEEPYFFYAGAIHPRKNIHRLIHAFNLFKERTGAPDKLLLAGRFAWKTGEVKDAYDASPYREDIRFLGYVPEEDLPRLTAAATALTYVSLSEGFGLPMLEAMYCDTPVMAANASCLPEIAGEAALLVDPLSVEHMAEGLEMLWKNAELRQNLIEKGRIQRELFSWEKAAQALFQVLEGMKGTKALSHKGAKPQRR